MLFCAKLCAYGKKPQPLNKAAAFNACFVAQAFAKHLIAAAYSDYGSAMRCKMEKAFVKPGISKPEQVCNCAFAAGEDYQVGSEQIRSCLNVANGNTF